MHYALTNYYASRISVGFANTWYALSFKTKRARDAYVVRANDLATRACTRAEALRTNDIKELV